MELLTSLASSTEGLCAKLLRDFGAAAADQGITKEGKRRAGILKPAGYGPGLVWSPQGLGIILGASPELF